MSAQKWLTLDDLVSNLFLLAVGWFCLLDLLSRINGRLRFFTADRSFFPLRPRTYRETGALKAHDGKTQVESVSPNQLKRFGRWGLFFLLSLAVVFWLIRCFQPLPEPGADGFITVYRISPWIGRVWIFAFAVNAINLYFVNELFFNKQASPFKRGSLETHKRSSPFILITKVGFAALWVGGTTWIVGAAFWNGLAGIRALNQGTAEVVCGRVAVLREQPYLNQYGNILLSERVQINKEEFRLNYNDVSFGYHRTISHGGDLCSGRLVRVHFLRDRKGAPGIILRVEINPHPNQENNSADEEPVQKHTFKKNGSPARLRIDLSAKHLSIPKLQVIFGKTLQNISLKLPKHGFGAL